jgi:uncharacterized protein (TIGR02466 family)|tara:strand:- start:2175 stop:2771 length:597 start_codon:yes stop_codon:yes gene_type:complete
MNITPLFSKPLYTNELNSNLLSIAHITNPLRSENNKLNTSNKKDFYVLETEENNFLKTIIQQEIKTFLNDTLKYANAFKITTSWFTEISKQQESHNHQHNNCFYSGVLYLQTANACGNIVFEDMTNRRYQVIVDEYNELNSRTWSIEPYDGLIVMFPSEVWHKVELNKSDVVRHSLAFNVMPTGLIGDELGDSQIYYE